MKTVYVMVGVPGSGKTSYVKEQIEGGHDTFVLSSDEIRERTGKDHAGVFEQMRITLKSILENNTPDEEQIQDIYYDATNTSRKRRRALYQYIKQCDSDAQVKIVFHSIPYSLAVAQNSKREGKFRIPEPVIKRMYLNQQPPRLLVDCDAFKVVGLPIFDKGSYLFPAIATDVADTFKHTTSMHWDNELRMSDTDHDCPPWHLESVFEHINMTIEASDWTLKPVAYFHDLGKGFAKVVDEEGFATYRGHQNISACYALNWYGLTVHEGGYISVPADLADKIEIIYQHMCFHRDLGHKNIRNNHLTESIINSGKAFAEIDSKSRIVDHEGIEFKELDTARRKGEKK